MKKIFVLAVLSLVTFVLRAQNGIKGQVDAALLSDGYFFECVVEFHVKNGAQGEKQLKGC